MNKDIAKSNQLNKKFDVRPVSNVFWYLIIICLILIFTGILSGLSFSTSITPILNNFGLNMQNYTENKLVWISFFSFFAVIMFGLGIMRFFIGISSSFMKNKTTGKIIESKIRSFYDSDLGDVYYIFSNVEYIVNNHKYQNESDHDFSSTDINKAKEKLNLIKSQESTEIVYDPKDPNNMVLEKKDKDLIGEIIAGLLFFTLGFLFSLVIGVIIH